MDEHKTTIFQKTSFFNWAEVLGIVFGFAAYLLLGARNSIIFPLINSCLPLLGMLYLIDRNAQYQKLSAPSHAVEQHQFQQYLQYCQFLLVVLLSMSTFSVKAAMFLDDRLFQHHRRVSCIGIV